MIYLLYIVVLLPLLLVAFLLLAPITLELSIARPKPGAALRLFVAWTYSGRLLGMTHSRDQSQRRTAYLLAGRRWVRQAAQSEPNQTAPPAQPPQPSRAAPPQSPQPPPPPPPKAPPADPPPQTTPPAQTVQPPTKSKAWPAKSKKVAAIGKNWSKADLFKLVLGPTLTLLKRLYRCVAVKDLRALGRFGLADPAQTGQLFALVQMAQTMAPRRLQLHLTPAFDRSGLEGSIRLRARLHLGYLLFSLLCFIVHLAGRWLGAYLMGRPAPPAASQPN